MSDEDAFLRAIQAAPDDRLPRLVYADWLDEHSQPEKAEYIRLTVEGRRASPDPGPRLGYAWLQLYSGHVRLWDAPTLLALGRLQGTLDGLAAANDHAANVVFQFSADLLSHDGDLFSLTRAVYGRGEPVVTCLEDWRETLRAELARWIEMGQGTASPRAVVRRAHQTPEGCGWTADRVLQLVCEVMTPEQGWQVQPPAGQRWGIDFSHFLLSGSRRALHLAFDFDD